MYEFEEFDSLNYPTIMMGAARKLALKYRNERKKTNGTQANKGTTKQSRTTRLPVVEGKKVIL